ncbi:MAG: YicC family protein [Myxococcales bacterium]|nr:YicC family protein [Myxococcales bacterium]
MLSMTGYGRAQADLMGGHIVVEVRSVNHRYLDVRVRFPAELSTHVARVEALVRASLVRGRVDVSARMVGSVGGTVTLDRTRARAAYNELLTLRDELAPGQEVPLSILGTFPDLFCRDDAPDQEQVEAAVEAATKHAMAGLVAMRQGEGEALARDLGNRLDSVRRIIRAIEPHTGAMVADYRTRLHKRIAALLEGAGAELDAARLEHEVAAFADRADINEELARLASHCDQFERLTTEGGPQGRRMDFLLQEMGREANTIGSKIADVEITRHIVELKAELERMREQVQNVL